MSIEMMPTPVTPENESEKKPLDLMMDIGLDSVRAQLAEFQTRFSELVQKEQQGMLSLADQAERDSLPDHIAELREIIEKREAGIDVLIEETLHNPPTGLLGLNDQLKYTSDREAHEKLYERIDGVVNSDAIGIYSEGVKNDLRRLWNALQEDRKHWEKTQSAAE